MKKNQETLTYRRDRMTMQAIRIFPDPVLLKKAGSVQNIDGHTKEIVDCMVETMYGNNGIGLAAPQIGISLQILIAGFENEWQAFVNPKVLGGEGEAVLEEGCLSLPKILVPVKRKETIFIRAWDLNGKERYLEISGFPSRVLQHEIDHLSGILIINHISRLKRKLLANKLRKDQKRSRIKNEILKETIP